MTSFRQCKSPCTPETKVSQTSGSVKKTFLTPCRRLGLARRSPSSRKTEENCGNAEYRHVGKVNETSNSSEEYGREKLCDPPDKCCKTPTKDFVVTFKGKNSSDMLNKMHDVYVEPTVRKEDIKVCVKQPVDINEPALSAGIESTAIVQVEIPSETSCNKHPRTEDNEIEPIPDNVTMESLQELRLRVKRKEDEIKELKLAQLYKRKHDLKRLSDLTERWCRGCQEALRELRDLSEDQGCRMTIQQLLEKLGIPNDLVRYDNDQEEFV